jgi:hypothetical protein
MALADRRTEDHEPFGIAGTEILSGVVEREEYNPLLRWPNAVLVYDEMRRSSPDVRAALQILKLPILGARPVINPPKPPDADDRARRDFLDYALLGTKMVTTWRRVLRHMLLSLDYGFSPSELVFTVDQFRNRPVYRYHKIASRLPRTLARWIVNRNGELAGMVQYGPAPETGRWQEFTIPGDYICNVVN